MVVSSFCEYVGVGGSGQQILVMFRGNEIPNFPHIEGISLTFRDPF